jgi:hypothetical protein
MEPCLNVASILRYKIKSDIRKALMRDRFFLSEWLC